MISKDEGAEGLQSALQRESGNIKTVIEGLRNIQKVDEDTVDAINLAAWNTNGLACMATTNLLRLDPIIVSERDTLKHVQEQAEIVAETLDTIDEWAPLYGGEEGAQHLAKVLEQGAWARG